MAEARYIFIETDDTCAACGRRRRPDRTVAWFFRRRGVGLTVHHIDHDPTNRCYQNEIVLCYECHLQHNQEKEPTTQQIKDRKRTLIHRTLTQYGVNAIKKAQRNEEGVVALPFLLHHLVDLGYMKEEESQMDYGELTVTARFTITDQGRNLYSLWLK